MKKKFSVLLIAILVLPLIALFGCDEALSYPIYVYSSSTIYGSVSGSGTYKEGQTITLTASAKKGSHVVGWIYQNSALIENGDSYKIENTTNSEQLPEKSILSFTLSEKTQGKYTAVFDDAKMMYIKLDSFRITSNPNLSGEADDPEKNAIMNANISLSQGSSSANLTTFYQTENLDIKDNTNITPEKVTDILKLSTTTNQHIKATTQLVYKEKTMSLNFRADIGFQTSTNQDPNSVEDDWIDSSNYSYQIKYSEGSYDVIFKFKVSTEDTFYLILSYKNLAIEKTA